MLEGSRRRKRGKKGKRALLKKKDKRDTEGAGRRSGYEARTYKGGKNKRILKTYATVWGDYDLN